MASRINSYVIQLAPASAAFIANRTTLGSWVLAGFLDCVVLYQLLTIFKACRAQRRRRSRLQKLYLCIVTAFTFLSLLNANGAGDIDRPDPDVYFFVDPDRVRTLVATAWCSFPHPTVSSDLAPFRLGLLDVLCRGEAQIPIAPGIDDLPGILLYQNWICCVPMVYAMCVWLAGGCLSVGRTSRYEVTLERLSIVAGHTQAKVHLVDVFLADFLITTGTIVSPGRRASGLPRTTQLLNRILRMVFESAVPPTIIATTDLILTQTLGFKLLCHLLVNAGLGKIYVINLLYTLNSVNEYRERDQRSSDRVYSYGNRRRVRPPTNVIKMSPRCTTRCA
ncbi:hypothetical protein B0H13DRAFT_2558412 [Mycena leptocephala]|nr:hypothetical protein B0H13DRAFT_2558412 [Mycena leptocephala]